MIAILITWLPITVLFCLAARFNISQDTVTGILMLALLSSVAEIVIQVHRNKEKTNEIKQLQQKLKQKKGE